MDLSFVTERVLALSFPADIDANTYQNSLKQAANMLQTKHGDNYMVFNLSLPRKELGKWNPRVLDVGWQNHLAPPLERLCSVCRALDSWLQADPQHIAVLHSKCGLERVGVVVSSYSEYIGLCANQDQSLDRFSMQRFLADRVGGLQRPSDKRYVHYFSGLLSGTIQVNSSPLFLDHVTVIGIPSFEPNGGCRAFFKVYQGSVPVYTSSIYHVNDNARHFTMSLEKGMQLRGDILIKCYHRYSKPQDGRETIFSVQFHTCAITDHTLVFSRQDLDDACQDLRFPLDGSVHLHFSTGADTRHLLNNSNTSYSVEPTAGDMVVRWDSYETVDPCSEEDDSTSTSQNVGPLQHTCGPLDGSLYAKVVKNKTPLNSPYLNYSKNASDSTVTCRSVRSHVHFIPDSNGELANTTHPRFINSPHVASTDSGISSAGVVRERNREAHLSGSSASPPHSGHSAESAAVFDPPTPTPSPIQLSDPLCNQPKMPSIVETRAEIHRETRDITAKNPAQSLGATAELDQLLTGMLMNVQNIPDIRPSQRHLHDDIDVDSIQVNFDLSSLPKKEDSTDSSINQKKNLNNTTYIYESDTVRRVNPAMGKSSINTEPAKLKDIPYHAREDSKPFTYGIVTNGNDITNVSSKTSAPPSPSIHRRNWKESQPATGLESPSLVRKFSTGSNSDLNGTITRSTPRVAVPSITDPASSPRPMRKLSDSLLSGSMTSSSSALPVATSSPRLESRSVFNETKSHSHTVSLEDTIQDVSTSPDSSRMTNDAGLSWLQRQQQKLRERKESLRRAERHPQEARLLSELRAAQQNSTHPSTVKGQRPGDDGYLSDTTWLSEHNISREGSPDVGTLYATPLHINTASYGQYQGKTIVHNGKAASSPGSPLLTHRSSSLERTGRYNTIQQQQHRTLTRQKSDMSHDRERPFVAVKRAHEQRKHSDTTGKAGSSPSDLLVAAPFGYVGFHRNNQSVNDSVNDSLLSTVADGAPNSNAKEDSVISWSSSVSGDDFGNVNRPVTPAFPVVPRTPYLNVHNSHHHQEMPTTPTTPTGAGLPPKSPTTQRKDRSPSPSPSPVYLGQSLSQSRRSSLQSVGGSSDPHEVSPIHVNFVKDTSRYWYKPNIAREDAINLLKDKSPGTFIVRDSNSFPGAFGLALKVATPPPHAANKNTGDPAAELVRHFLIEPTSKGVRIKGCNNEPVFGSLSALIYQHSITPLALPCKLVLPEADVVLDTVDSPSTASQLLTQGAACNVLYLFTMDTESLTGPQAIQRTMSHLLDLKPLPSPTVVHFKVSSQGITLTDSERKLFFRRHYPVVAVSFCGLDPEDRRWNQRSEETGLPVSSNRCFGFVARKAASKTDNQCHIFAELEPEQPATAIVNFVTKVMMTLSPTYKNNV